MENVKSKLNVFYWVLAIALLAAGVVANTHFSEIAWTLRLAGWVLLFILLAALFALTEEGKRFWVFAKESRVELRKVVWPKREETVKTTMIIAALVVVAAMIMWGLDSILMLMIGWLTGQ